MRERCEASPAKQQSHRTKGACLYGAARPPCNRSRKRDIFLSRGLLTGLRARFVNEAPNIFISQRINREEASEGVEP